jgi:hypothetical protein
MSTALRRVANEGESALTHVAHLDTLDGERAAQLLFACCPSRRWAREVSAGRPYGSMRQLLTAADDVLADLSVGDVERCCALLHEATAEGPAAAREQLRTTMRRNLLTTLR